MTLLSTLQQINNGNTLTLTRIHTCILAYTLIRTHIHTPQEGANMSLLPALQQNNKIAMADTRLENTMVCQVSLAETPGRVRGHPGGV